MADGAIYRPFREDHNEMRDSSGGFIQLCCIEEMLETPDRVAAMTTFGGFALCRDHFEEAVVTLQEGMSMGVFLMAYVNKKEAPDERG